MSINNLEIRDICGKSRLGKLSVSGIDPMNPVCKCLPDTLCIILMNMVVRKTDNIIFNYKQHLRATTLLQIRDSYASRNYCEEHKRLAVAIYLACELRIIEVDMCCRLPSALVSRKPVPALSLFE